MPSGTARVEVSGHQWNGQVCMWMCVHLCPCQLSLYILGIIQLVKTAKRSFVKYQFDPVEDKYVYSLHHCGFQSVSFDNIIIVLTIYVGTLYGHVCSVQLAL